MDHVKRVEVLPFMAAQILIADDNEVIRGVLSELLRNHKGWEVCAEVGNGRQAVLKAAELKPEVIILDLAMPGLDGLTATREILKILPSVPIVLYTLHSSPVVELEAKKAGVRRVIAKPQSGLLLRAIEELLSEQARSGTSNTIFPSTDTKSSVAVANHADQPSIEADAGPPIEPN